MIDSCSHRDADAEQDLTAEQQKLEAEVFEKRREVAALKAALQAGQAPGGDAGSLNALKLRGQALVSSLKFSKDQLSKWREMPRCSNDSNYDGVFAALLGGLVPRRIQGCAQCGLPMQD